ALFGFVVPSPENDVRFVLSTDGYGLTTSLLCRNWTSQSSNVNVYVFFGRFAQTSDQNLSEGVVFLRDILEFGYEDYHFLTKNRKGVSLRTLHGYRIFNRLDCLLSCPEFFENANAVTICTKRNTPSSYFTSYQAVWCCISD